MIVIQAKIKSAGNAEEIVDSLLNLIALYALIHLNMIMTRTQYVDIALPTNPNTIKQFLSLDMMNIAKKLSINLNITTICIY